MNVLDYVLIVFLLFGFWQGYVRGLIRTITNLLGYLIGFACAIYFSDVATLMLSNQFHDFVQGIVGKYVHFPETVSTMSLDVFSPDQAKAVVSQMSLTPDYQNQVYEVFDKMGGLAVNSQIENLGDGLIYIISDYILQAIAFIVIFFVVEKAFTFMGWVFSKLFANGIFGSLDAYLGALCGLGKNLLIVTVCLMVMQPLVAMDHFLDENKSSSTISKVNHTISGSVVCNMITDIVK